MLVQSAPDTLTKLAELGDAARFEPAGDRPAQEGAHTRVHTRNLADCIMHAATPGGTKPILKAMLTTACERNCYYCPFRAGRTKTARITFTPEEMARGFHTLHQAGQADGLFLTTGIIKGSVATQDRLIDTAEIIRKRYGYGGYLHLKIMPGAEYDQVYRAMQLATRVSVNLEAPSQERLSALAPKKDFGRELLQMLRWAEDIRRAHPQERLANTVTQFVVGAVGDTDQELLALGARLYREMGLTRTYYSAFDPVVQTPFENLAATDPLREHRLYQASFLLRDYAWNVADLPFERDGNLRTDVDPKRAWADQWLRPAPVEIMTASRADLLRVPGIGPTTADAILQARPGRRLRDLSQLSALGLRAPEQAAPYILLDGRRAPTQLPLF
jgi:predicted DNA-binding helix-hairpin-helix protein